MEPEKIFIIALSDNTAIKKTTLPTNKNVKQKLLVKGAKNLKPSFSSFIFMYISFFIYSLSGIAMKIAGSYELFSFKYLLFLAVSVFILGIYAVLWQIVLKKVDLSVAMANRSVILVLAFLWSVLLFEEQLTLKTTIGIVFVFTGIFVLNCKRNVDE